MAFGFDRSKRIGLALVVSLAGLCLVLTATAGASSKRSQGVPGWGDPGGCYYGVNAKCWVYQHPADQGRSSCQVVDIAYDPGHSGPSTYRRSAATDVANIAVGEGYQWAGGCYDNDDRDPTANAYPRETKSTLGEGPDCSGLVWRVWRESNRLNPSDNSFYFWPRSTYDHGPYNTTAFKYATSGSGAPHVKYDKGSIILMDALASDTHIALEQFRIDSGSDFVWEALGDAYGTNEWIETYRSQTKFSGVRRLAWG
jgi:hypothetical protein